MKGFASRTGTKRNLRGLRERGWGLIVSRAGAWRTEGFEAWAAENGAWADKLADRPFDGAEFERFLEWVAAQPIQPLWIALPDIVEGGLDSLALSRRWYRLLRRRKSFRTAELMLVVQDGMEPRHVRRLVGPNCGVFVGGSTGWKLSTMKRWGALARSRGAKFHVGRVNSMRRIRLCEDAGADSFDGTSATMYAETLPRLDAARRQTSLEGFLARAA